MINRRCSITRLPYREETFKHSTQFSSDKVLRFPITCINYINNSNRDQILIAIITRITQKCKTTRNLDKRGNATFFYGSSKFRISLLQKYPINDIILPVVKLTIMFHFIQMYFPSMFIISFYQAKGTRLFAQKIIYYLL